MKKRQRTDNVPISQSKVIMYPNLGLLKSFEARGILEEVYSFLMDPHNPFSTTDYYFSIFRMICKTTKTWSNRLSWFINPVIRSEANAKKWHAMVPNLRHLQLKRTIFHLEFLHLRSLTIDNEVIITATSIKSWNCPLLEYLDSKIAITNSEIRLFSVKFPKLKRFSMRPKCNWYDGNDVIINGFEYLETLIIRSKFQTPLRVHISNMPNLIDFKITNGLIGELNFRKTPNLKSISYSYVSFNLGLFDKLIFHDPVPLLECLALEEMRYAHHCFTEIDPKNNVSWEKVKKLQFVYTKKTEQICSRLKAIEHLEIDELEPLNINWSKLIHLTHLGWKFPTFDLLSSIMVIKQNITSLTIQWNHTFIMDFAMLLHFPNLKDVTMITTNGQYVHFKALFQLPKLKTLCCDMTNLSTKEKLLLSHWQISKQ
jgi:hypothetical protein